MTSRADLPAAPRPASPDLSLGKQSLPASREPHLAKLSSPLPHAPPAETHSDFVPHVSDLEKQPTRDAGPPYTIFVASQRATVVVLLTSVGFLSPITGSIYMSGLTDVSRDLLVSQEMVQLSVTVFMIFQGISPLIIGSNTDKVGRRPVLIFSLVLYMAADIGIYFLPHATHSNKGAVYAGLLILRAVQACGSASTVSIGAGGIQDITEPANRGGVMGIFGSTAATGPAIAPTIGSALTTGWGWRSIFMFLFVLAALELIILLFFLPETLRSLVGNGSDPAPSRLHESWAGLIRGTTVTQRTGRARPGLPTGITPGELATLSRSAVRKRVIRKRIRETFALTPVRNLFIPEVLLCLLTYSLPYTAQFMILSTTSQIYQQEYGWTLMEAGLVFLAIGSGSASSSFISGQLLNRNFQAVQARFRAAQAKAEVATRPSSSSSSSSLSPSQAARSKNWPKGYDPAHFPIEQARLRLYPLAIGINIAATLVYGWLIDAHVHPAAPIPFLFLIGLGVGTVSNIINTLLLDYLPGKGAGATASLNLVRCLLGAAGVAASERMLARLGPGRAFTIVAAISACSIPCAAGMWLKGAACRAKRFAQ